MSIGTICNQEVVVAGRGITARAAAQMMRERHVGSLVVIDEDDERRTPIGMVTDRDIVVAVVALGLDAEAIRVEDVMSAELLAVEEDAGIAETLELMHLRGVRRLPVTRAGGALIGIVTVDDLFSLLAEEMASLAKIVSRGRKREVESRRNGRNAR
ncbi:MAG: CBS domain-containing protein [Burkholderiales bacterium]